MLMEHVYINVEDETGKVEVVVGGYTEESTNLWTMGGIQCSDILALTTPESLLLAGHEPAPGGTKHVGDVRLWLQNGATLRINRDGGFRYGWVPFYSMNELQPGHGTPRW